MKLLGILRFELAYQLRRPSTWIFFVAVALFSYGNSGDESVAEALYEDFFLNSPFAIAKTTVVGTLLWLLSAAVVAGGAAARDVEHGMHPLVWTTPVSKAEYLGGRFLAAFTLNALILAGVQAGIVFGVHGPGANPEAVGPFGATPFLAAYAIISLPTAFAATALQFFLAARSGRPMAAYLGSFLLFFMGIFVAALLLYYRSVGTLVDPIGMRYIIEDLAHEWTPTERKWRALTLEGTVLWNRLVWVGVGVLALAATWLRFRFAHHTGRRGWWHRRRDARAARRAARGVASPAPDDAGAGTPIAAPVVPRSFGLATQARQTVALAWGAFRAMATSRLGLAMLLGIPLVTFIAVLDQLTSGGIDRIPTTALVLSELTTPLSAELSRWVFIPLLLVFCAGELVWRERDAGLGELTDAMPTADWPLLLARFLAIAFVIALFMTLLAVGGMLAQSTLGHRDFQIGLYLRILLGLQLAEYLLFALLAVVVHVIVNQKYLGHLLAIVLHAFIVVPAMFGVENDLAVYATGPMWSYTEMRGFGASLQPWMWYRLYWAAWALLLAVAARLLWVRGRDGDLRARLRLARRRLAGPTARAAAIALALVLALGGFVYYDTRVIHASRTGAEYDALLAEYERRYGRFEGVAQPRLTGVRLHVEFHPARRTLEVRGTYRMVNRSDVPIDSVHVAFIPGAENRSFDFDRPAAPVLTDEVRGHRIHALETPLQPGDSLQLRFEVRVAPRGFGVQSVHESVVANGSFFANTDWLPAIGYQPRRELRTAGDRRKHGLPPRALVGSLHDASARMAAADRITFEAVVGTAGNQVAVAPGLLRRTWIDAGRRYFRYVVDGTITNDYAVFSADYAVARARWTPTAAPDAAATDTARAVEIRIFHHPTHTVNVDRWIRSIRASLDYYTKQYGPYPYGHFTAVEVRGNEIGMHADPSLVRFSEETALLNPGNHPRSVDLPFEIMAHEVSHQWWGHQLEPAYVEGGPVLGEGLAVFSAMGVVEKSLGRDHLLRLMKVMRLPFPFAPIRRGEPLLRGLDSYLAYRKGPFALHALAERIGRDRVDAAMRRLIEQHPAGSVPLATMLDLYAELRTVTPDSLHGLLHDLFEVNTVWMLDLERATAEPAPDGTWRVTLDVRARQVVVDTAGVETEVPMDEWVEIGVFARVPDGHPKLSAPLLLQRHRVRSGRQAITVTVPSDPSVAGVDPYHVLDWEEREDDNNLAQVKIDRRGRPARPEEERAQPRGGGATRR